jgi:hypothetical protein
MGQSTPWVRQFGSPDGDQLTGVATDSAGNIYAAGYTFGGSLLREDTQASGTAFVIKFNSAGVVQWVRRFGPPFAPPLPSSVFSDAIAVTPGGDVYVAGRTVTSLSGLPFLGGFFDAFLRKYNTRGEEQWTRLAGTAGDDIAAAATTDGAGNVYIAGTTTGAFSGSANAGGVDAFVAAFNAGGTSLWTRQFGSPLSDNASGLAIDGAGGVIVAGVTEGTLPGQTSGGSEDLYLRRFTASGAEVWTRQVALSGTQFGGSVAADRSGGIYLTGINSAETVSGPTDALIRKYNLAGNQVWSRDFATGSGDEALDVAVHPNGNIHVAGLTQPDAGAFVARYSSNGAILSSWIFSTRVPGCSDGLAIDSNGNTYIGGVTSGVLAGNINTGGLDACLLRLNESDIGRNNPPIARCASFPVVAETGKFCAANASIADPFLGPFDPDPGDRLFQVQVPPGPYRVSSTPQDVTLTVTDNHGASASCAGQVQVVDGTEPLISPIIVDRPVIFPANGAMVRVRLLYVGLDNCGSKSCAITNVFSSDPVTGPDNTSPDWVIVSRHEVQLRAEVSSSAARTYAIVVQCTDSAGNASERTVTVRVLASLGR